MKSTKKLVVLMAAAFLTLVGSSAVAKSPWQTFEIDFPIDLGYVDCLGEEVSVHYWATVRTREFETPSGNYHFTEPWTWEPVWIGQVTGRIWIGRGGSPGGVTNTGKGEVVQWTSHELAKPVEGDGPKFRYNQRFKVTVNANGELKVFHEPPVDFADWIHCLGPKD